MKKGEKLELWDGLRKFSEECGGMAQCFLLRPQDALIVFAMGVIEGDEFSKMIISVVDAYLANLRECPEEDKPSCCSCDKQFVLKDDIPNSFCILFPMVKDESNTIIVTGICETCSKIDNAGIKEKLKGRLAEVWENVDFLDKSVFSSEVGHA